MILTCMFSLPITMHSERSSVFNPETNWPFDGQEWLGLCT